MNTWNPKNSREPDKKDDVAFKDFLITKYQKKQWYKSPAEIKRESEANGPPKPDPVLQPPPPSVKVSHSVSFRPHNSSLEGAMELKFAPSAPLEMLFRW